MNTNTNNNAFEIKYKVGKIDECFDEKGNTSLMLRHISWEKRDSKEYGEEGLELRKFYITADGKETPGKGIRFLTEDGPHKLVSTLLEHGFGKTQESIRILSQREDFESSLINVIGLTKVQEAKSVSPKVKYFDPRELAKR